MLAETGFSVYLGTEIEKTECIISKAEKAGAKYVFTSLNISEEKEEKYKKLAHIADICRERKLNLIVDINRTTKGIVDMNLENIYFRIDDGLSKEEVLKICRLHKIVLNASTVTSEELEFYKRNGADFSKILSLHNFYPKKFTGISRTYLKEQNMKYRQYGIKTMAFVPGDELRGPVYEGLPTVEEHRDRRFLSSCLDLISLDTDIVLIGDIDVCDEKWDEMGYLSRGVIPLRNTDDILTDEIFSDRQDSSEYVVRFAVTGIGETRRKFSEYILKKLKESGITYEILEKNHKRSRGSIRKGDILLSNRKYLRYEGEIEIALQNLGEDNKRDVISRVIKEDIELLDYIRIMKKCIFVKKVKKKI